ELMELRVTPQVVFNQTILYAQQEEASLAELQEESATGKTILVPSDNPVNEVQVLASNTENLNFTTYLANNQSAQSTITAGTAALQDVNSLFTQATQIASEANNSNSDATSNAALASQVNDLLTS